MKRSRSLSLFFSVLGVLVLNGILLIHIWLPEYQFLRIITSSVELIALYVLFYFCSLMPERRDRLVITVVGAVVAGVFFFSAGEAFTRFWYDQPFVPKTDLRFIPAVIEMVLHVPTDRVLVPIIIGAILAAVWVVFVVFGRWLIGSIRRVGSAYLAAPAFLLLMSVAFGFGPSVTKLVATAFPSPSTISEADTLPEVETRKISASFAFLDDADVFLIIVESYGYTLFSNPPHRELIMPFYASYEPLLEQSGFTVFSNFLDSPTTGGRSWLADATLWTGTRVSSQQKYDDLVGSDVGNVLQILNRAGYYTALIAPGTKEADEEWRSYYEFDEFRLRWDFGYKGPFFNLGAMPDQYILRQAAQSAASQAREGKPYFATVILVSSHVPFDRVPQYVEDWDSLGNGEIYSSLEMQLFENNWLGGNEYPEGYTASIGYSLTAAFEFVMRYLPDNGLAIVVGDHQPRIPVRERGASSSVPIHVVSKRHDLAAAFSSFGYTEGVVPHQSLPHRGMERFLDDLLAVFRGIPSTPFIP